MSLKTQVLLGLAVGLAVGAAAAATEHPTLLVLGSVAEPVGALWLNALRMTVIPLVMSLLVTGVASASKAAAAGRVAARTLVVIACVLVAAGTFAAVAGPLLMAWFPIHPDTTAAVRSTLRASGEPAPAPGFVEWVTGIVPANPIEAAAEGAMLPLVVFSLLLGLAATRLGAEHRGVLLGFFRAIGEVMMVIVGWVLRLAPVGVFALVLPLVAGAGLGAVGALGHYVVLTCALCMVVILCLYPVAALVVGVSVQRFASAAAPAQAVAFSTSSSLASLPAMLEGVQGRLGLPPSVAGLVLPLAVSLMRISSPVKTLFAAVFAAALFGVELTPATLAAGAAVAIATSLGSVGLPGGVMFMATKLPVFTAMGVPIEVLGPMLAVEPIPDTFGTVANVTADVAATAVVAHGVGAVAPAAAPDPAAAGAAALALVPAAAGVAAERSELP
jgi:Na+/H+-dicarboxylate symporter